MKLLPTELSIIWINEESFEEYARFNPSLSWVGKDSKGKAEQLLRWTTCREIFTSQLKKDIVGKSNKICADHTRFALKSTYSKTSGALKHKGIFKSGDKAMETAMKMLNVIEKEAGWDLTVITKSKRKVIKNVDKDKVIINTYIIRGPKEWMRSTPVISLYTLIIRSGWFRGFSKIKQVEDIAPACKKIIDGECLIEKIRQHIELIKISYEYWLLLVLNIETLFGERLPNIIYKYNNEYSGISKLICLSHDIDGTTRERWTKLVKEYKK